MHFPTLLLTGAATLASLASADNAFTMTGPYNVVAGTPFNITWASTTGSSDTVSLFLRQGDANALNTVATIASSIQNTGTYLWTPSPTLPSGSNYAFEIVDSKDPNINNYSNQFSLSSSVTASSSSTSATSSSSLSAATASSSSSAGTPTSTVTVAALTTSIAFSNSTMTSAAGSGSSSEAASSSQTGIGTQTGKETTASKTGEAGKTGSSMASGTKSGGASTATGNSGCAVKVPGVGRAGGVAVVWGLAVMAGFMVGL